MTKKLIVWIFCVSIFVGPMLVGCGGSAGNPSGKSDAEVEADIQAAYKKVQATKGKKSE